MKEPFELVHKNQYRLSCRPEPTPDGKFLARAIVSWIDKGGEALSHRLRPEMDAFATAAEAAMAGREAAVAWVDAREAEIVAIAAAAPHAVEVASSPPSADLPMLHTIYDVGVARQIGSYSDAVEAGPNLRWLMTSGTPGPAAAGELPRDIVGQSDIAWQHVVAMLAKAGMTVADIVKVTQYLTRAEDIAAYAKVRSRFLGEMRPASMLLIVPQLVWPGFLIEVEVIAAKAAAPV
ncbi:MAG: RidA family protein [Pseudomonadota bacterium]|nr:RidA family protein [Pseudomonadota bacterium]